MKTLTIYFVDDKSLLVVNDFKIIFHVLLTILNEALINQN